jgi:hypothetical protein
MEGIGPGCESGDEKKEVVMKKVLVSALVAGIVALGLAGCCHMGGHCCCCKKDANPPNTGQPAKAHPATEHPK